MRLSILAPLMLAACTAAPPAERDEASPASAPAQAPSATATAAPIAPAVIVALPGEYRVAGVDGGDIDQPYAIAASITGQRIHVTADCLNFAWSYTLQANRIATTRVAVEGCARGPTRAEEAMVAAFDGARTVARTPANGIELRGPEHVVTLFSQ